MWDEVFLKVGERIYNNVKKLFKCLVINPTRNVENFYTENYKCYWEKNEAVNK